MRASRQTLFIESTWRQMMRKRIEIPCSAGIALAMLLLSVFLVFPAQVAAKSKVVAIEGMNYQADASMQDNLKSLIGKKVSVACASGKTFTGFVKKVGNHMVHLEKLANKEYFDALIRIDTISGVETQFRKLQR